MNPLPFEKVYEIATHALALSGRERLAYLDSACRDDATLRRAVLDILVQTETASGQDQYEDMSKGVRAQLVDIVEEQERPQAEADWLPERVGPFRVLRRIGQGGMGIVYEAQQESPTRVVALKVMTPQTVTHEATRRFRLEAEALGRLQHPGIAQVFAADSADLGFGEQPYLAMEFIDGQQLLEYVHAQRLDTRARVALLATLCDAVEHAHGRGIIHRDIKPDNVLVDREGRAKLLDFGIASVTGEATLAQSISPESGRLLGSMSYMAPEQARTDPTRIGARSDEFALGAVGFEMLSAQLPRDIAGLSITQALTRVAQGDARRLRSVVPNVSRDLDTILGKALETRPEDRYGSVAELAADLRRFLENRPILGSPPSRLDWAIKTARRNRALVAGITATFIALVLGVVFTTLQANRANRHSALNAQAREEARRNLYFSEMQLAATASMSKQGFAYARKLAARWVPIAGEEDLRGWEWKFFDSLNRGAPVSLATDRQPMCATWHPSGESIAVLQTDGISLYDPDSGQEIQHWSFQEDGPGGLGLGISWSPDGQRLFSIGYGFALVLDLESQTQVWTRPGSYARQHSWSPDGTRLFVVHEGQIEEIDTNTGEVLRESQFDSNIFQGLHFDSVRPRLLFARPSLNIVDPNSFELIRTVDGPTRMISSIAVHPTRNVIATTGRNGSFIVQDLDQPGWEFESPPGPLALRHGDFDPSGRWLSVASDDTTVEVWDWEAGQKHHVLRWHTYRAVHTDWSPDSKRLLTVSAYRDVQVHTIGSPIPYRAIPVLAWENNAEHTFLDWSPSGDLILVADSGTTEIWDARTGKRVWQGAGGEAYFLPSGKGFIQGQADRWEVRRHTDGALVSSLSRPEKHSVVITAMHPTRDTWATNNDIELWMAEATDPSQPTLRKVSDSKGQFSTVLHPTKNHALLFNSSGSITVRDLTTGEIVSEQANLIPGLTSVSINPTGEWLACGFDDSTIRVCNSHDLTWAFELSGHVSIVRSLHWSPNGEQLASSAQDYTLKIWNIKHRALVASFQTDGILNSVRWRRDGGAVAALGLDRMLHIWDATFADEIPKRNAPDPLPGKH